MLLPTARLSKAPQTAAMACTKTCPPCHRSLHKARQSTSTTASRRSCPGRRRSTCPSSACSTQAFQSLISRARKWKSLRSSCTGTCTFMGFPRVLTRYNVLAQYRRKRGDAQRRCPHQPMEGSGFAVGNNATHAGQVDIQLHQTCHFLLGHFPHPALCSQNGACISDNLCYDTFIKLAYRSTQTLAFTIIGLQKYSWHLQACLWLSPHISGASLCIDSS